MAVREFNGVTTTGDYLDFGPGAVGAINNGVIAFSMLILMKPLELVNVDPYFSIGRSASQTLAAMYYPASGTILAYGDDDPGNDLSATSMNVALNQWQVFGFSKPAGTAQVRAHRKQLGSGVWTHTDIGSASSSSGAATTVITIARFATASNERSFMRAAVAAIWQTNLSDANFVTIEAAASTAAIYAQSPTWLVEFNQTNVATAVLDLTSGHGDQTVRVGTSVVTTDDPAWTFGLTSPTAADNPPIGILGRGAGW